MTRRGPRSTPPDTARLRFRPMAAADLDLMASLLGDPDVMRFYPRPKSRSEAQDWIEWNARNYAAYGCGLWIVETHDGAFVGDCGLTWQQVGDQRSLEIGYHTMPEFQGCGYATEAAGQCLDFAAQVTGERHVVAIINPANVASRRVAEKLGMVVEQETTVHGGPAVVYGVALGGGSSR